METKARHFIVGLGLILLGIGFTLSTLWYAKDIDLTATDDFAIYFKKQSVSGLQVGSPVTIRGIPVGEVTKIGIIPKESIGARIQVTIQNDVPISGQNRAVIERNLLTGLASIEITRDEQAETPNLQPKAEKLPLIYEGEGEVEKIKVSLTETVGNLNATLSSVQNLLNDQKRQEVWNTIANLEKLSSSLVEKSELLDKTLDNTNKLLNNSNGLVNTINYTSEVLARETALTAQTVREATNRIANTVDKYKEPRRLISGPALNNLGPGEQ
jgi:phospholipid/cholesterol/gamma-HCH transport system substrate-binding protein